MAARSTRSRARPRRPARCWSSGSRSIPAYAQRQDALDRRRACAPAVLRTSDAEGFARTEAWTPGAAVAPPPMPADRARAQALLTPILDRAMRRARAERSATSSRCSPRAARASTRSAPPPTRCAPRPCGERVSYVVTRNINYTNICAYRCTFCAFSKGKTHETSARPALRSRARRDRSAAADEAWERGAREVCLQGGIHPRLHRRDLSRDLPRHQGRGARTCTSTPSRRSRSRRARRRSA